MAVSESTEQARMPSATPAITATALLNASAHDQAVLKDVYELLNMLFVRNINQHRRSHWWKSLHAFRKETRLLLAEMEGKKNEREAKLQARLRYWDEKCIHQWYYQFSQLVSVGPFAMLGLVMMASVARVCRVTGITSVYEEIASSDIQNVLASSNELSLAEDFGDVLDQVEEDEWDVGVVVQREA